jgi:hypothetical protein
MTDAEEAARRQEEAESVREAERALIGAALLDPAVAAALDVEPDACIADEHRTILRAIYHVRETRGASAVDGMIVNARVASESVAGRGVPVALSYLAACQSVCPDSDNWRHYAEIVRDAIPAATRRTGGHPATRTFQALRIAVNEELASLEATLPVAIDRLQEDGILVVLSYHSLEDRIVKRAFAAAATGCVCPPRLAVCGCGQTARVAHVVRRPLGPDEVELAANPRSASVRLRAVRRLAVAA